MSDSDSVKPEPPAAEGEGINASPLLREAYFPTFIFFRDLAGADALNAHLLPAIRAERTADQVGIERSNVPQLGGWHSRNDLDRRPEFAALTNHILTFCAEVGASLGYDPARPLAIDNMWAIINPPGSHNRTHIHPNSLWSGVYYIQAPNGAGRISFVDPRTQNLTSVPRYDPDKPRTADNWTEVFFEPIPGRLLLFPSWLYHGVESNTTDQTGDAGERVIASFNIFQHNPR